MRQDELNFDGIESIEVPVRVAGIDYLLKEATGEAARKYRNACLVGVEMEFNDDAGTRTTKKMQSLASVESYLISMCLFEKVEGEFSRLVPQCIIEGWPSKIQRRIFDKAKEISELEEKDDLPALEKQLDRIQTKIKRLKENTTKNSQNGQQS